MDEIERFLAVTAIRKVKATYWYATDAKDWNRLAGVFTPDAIFDMRGEPFRNPGQALTSLPPVDTIAPGDPAIMVGAKAIVESISSLVNKWVTVHIGGEPIIDILGPDTATGIWPLFDYVDDGTHSVKAYGHYYETYKKIGEDWLIDYLILTRLRIDGTPPWTIPSPE